MSSETVRRLDAVEKRMADLEKEVKLLKNPQPKKKLVKKKGGNK